MSKSKHDRMTNLSSMHKRATARLGLVRGFVLAGLLSIAMMTVMAGSAFATDLAIHVINLGSGSFEKGDAVLLESQGQYLLIDTGTEATKNVVINYLKEQGVSHMAVYISHFHTDHYGALRSLDNAGINVDAIYVGPRSIVADAVELGRAGGLSGDQLSKLEDTLNFYDSMPAKVAKGIYGDAWVPVYAGHTFTVGAATVETLGTPSFNLNQFSDDVPSKTAILTETKSEHYLNNMSLCTRISVNSGGKTIRYLTCGDAEKDEENWLISNHSVNAEILKMNHHGTDSSNTLAFLKSVGAKYAIANHNAIPKEISRQNSIYKNFKYKFRESANTAKKNLYGMIRTQIPMLNAEKLGAEVYRTEFNGGVVFRVQDGNINVTTENGFVKKGGKWYLKWGGKIVKPNKQGLIVGFNGAGTAFKAEKNGALKKDVYKYKYKGQTYFFISNGPHDTPFTNPAKYEKDFSGFHKWKGKKYYVMPFSTHVAQKPVYIDGKLFYRPGKIKGVK